jgi:2,4-dienoyl-CoA reductase-like NADH-dependent reductase (Old Yellow Enzyme family)
MTPAETLAVPLDLPCGATLPNRIAKSAMSEILAPDHTPTDGLCRLYRRWSEGGLGLSITGNVMIDRRALGEPANVVLESGADLEPFRRWAQAATVNGNHAWMQLNHPGKQSPRFLSKETVAPSAVGFGPTLSKGFAIPRALEVAEITDLVQRFGAAAGMAKEAGFTGVQIHGAHGYLVSQFLSPHHNQRADEYGGSAGNRSRFVMEVYAAMRDAVGPGFPVSIKLNSADFQKGGFAEEDSVAVMTQLQEAGIDLIEVSGGTYESPAMTGWKSDRTKAREGYFMDFLGRARESLTVPLCITGGFRTPAGMAAAVEGAADVVALARTLCVQPEFPNQVLAGEDVASLVQRLTTGNRTVDTLSMLEVSWYENQLARMADGKDPLPNLGAWRSVASSMWKQGAGAFKVRRAR